MKYSHSSKYRKTCRHDPDTRAELGFRLRYARLKLGWSIEDAGKYFQVTDRTWHNWESGSHRIPFAVYKLARILARQELPSEAWAGWRLEGSVLITPEGRQITPQDGSWWSLLVRQAAGFRWAYAEANRLRLELGQITGAPLGRKASEAQPMPCAEGAGLVPYKTTLESTRNYPSNRHQNDVIIESWPILYDFPTPLTPLHAPKQTTLGSALTPCYASPWTPTCEVREPMVRPEQSQHRSLKSQPEPASPSLRRSNLPSSQGPKSKLPTRKTSANDKSSFANNSQSGRPSGATAHAQASALGGAA